ncbi:MAG: hypothetical protein JOZ66_18685, partial [Hyphomicrobiales bacterium]|nr:hypothetical protein [Hyphomicrobiales bacterium]
FGGEILEAGDFIEQPPDGLVARARRGVKPGYDCQLGGCPSFAARRGILSTGVGK